MLRPLLLCLIVLTAFAGCGSTPSTGSSRSLATYRASGMVRLDHMSYLLVNDTKVGEQGPRLGILKFSADMTPAYTELQANWESVGGLSNDLECLCAIPGREGEFLAAESRYRGNRFGRLIHFSLEPASEAGGERIAQMLGVLQLPRLYDQIEGMDIGRAANGNLILVLGERGTDDLGGKISWGQIEFTGDSMSFLIQGDFSFKAPQLSAHEDTRDCTDLYIDGQNRLWVAAAIDRGNKGPFESVVFRLGTFDARRHRPTMSLDPLEVMWQLDGFKVEAIGAALSDPESLGFISEDEDLGGIWRPLPRPRSQWGR